MNLHELLLDTFYFLIASLVLVPFFRYLKLSPVLGYIVAGIIIGPEALGLIDETTSIVQLGEIGITLLLFVVGLELSPVRLKALRSSIIFLGGGQVLITAASVSALSFALGVNLTASIAVGLAFSLSSTAFALSYLTKSGQLTTGFGQASLSILLCQDLLIVPILAVLPLLSVESNPTQTINWLEMSVKALTIGGILAACFFSLKFVISMLKDTADREITLAAFLFFIIGMTIGMDKLGFSMSIGAFIAGLFLANTEIKNDLYRTITPFKGILMGLFFMTLGLGLDFNYVKDNLFTLATLVLSVCFVKGSILAFLVKMKTDRMKPSFLVSVLLFQVGEFGIVVLEKASNLNILTAQMSQLLVSSALLSMVFSPLILRGVELVLEFKERGQEDEHAGSNVVSLRASRKEEASEEDLNKAS